MKKFLKIVLLVAGSLVLILVLLAAATQTQFFRDRLRTAALENLGKVLAAEIRMGEVRGNLVTGFSVDSVGIAYQGSDVLRVDQLRLRYNLLEVPGRKISIRDLTLMRPMIHLVRFRNGQWNAGAMVRARNDTTPSGTFDWKIALGQLEIKGGTLILTDSTVQEAQEGATPPGGAGPRHATGEEEPGTGVREITLRDLNLAAAGSFAAAEKHLQIASLSFASAAPEFTLKRLAGDFVVSPEGASVRDFSLTTGGSSIELNASLRDVDLLDSLSLGRLRDAPVRLDLHAHDLSLDELKLFLPPLEFLNGPLTLDLAAAGEFGDLTVQRLDLVTGRNKLYMRGRVANLHVPEHLTLGVKISESRISMSDLRTLMPSFDLPELAPLGLATLNLEFDGRPLDFRTKFLLETAAGNVRTEGSLRIGGRQVLAYNGELTLQQVNLAGVLEQESLDSKLNGTVRIAGEGIHMKTLNARLDAAMEGSEFRGLPLTIPALTVSAAGQRVTAHADITLGEMTSSLSASLDEQNAEAPAFDVEGHVAALNLATLLRDKAYDSDLTLGLTVHGRGLQWSTLGGDLLLDLSSSRYRGYRLSNGDVHLQLDQSNPTAKALTLESNIAEFSLTGAFDLEYMTQLIAYEVRNLRVAIGEKFAALDTSMAASVDRAQLAAQGRALADTARRLDAQYMLKVKDLEPLSMVAGDKTFNGTGTVTGSIRGNQHELSVRSQLDVADFFYGDVEAGALVRDASVTCIVNKLKPVDPLRDIDVRLSVNAARVHVNSDQLDSLDLVFAYQQEYARYSAHARANNAIAAALQGQARVARDTVTVILDDLQGSYQAFAWRADSGAVIKIAPAAVSVAGLVMRRDTQVVALGGTLGTDGALAARVDAEHMNLDDLKYFLTNAELGGKREAFTGGAEAHIVASGTVRRPVYEAHLRAGRIAFRGIPFGTLGGTLHYDDGLMDAHLEGGPEMAGSEGPALTIHGTLPVNLSPADSGEAGRADAASAAATIGEGAGAGGADSEAVRIQGSGGPAGNGERRDRPMNLTIHSSGVQMSILDPLLPTFNNLSGILRCDLNIGGSLQHPQYTGALTIADCGFLFVPNNIQYALEGNFAAEGERLKVTDAVIRNIPADERGGRNGLIHITGDLSLRDLVPGDFNLSATGQLLVVKETTRQSSLSVYGDLFVQIGPGGLHFTGEIERSLLKGSVLINNSTLAFPPAQATVAEESPTSVPVVLVDDTARAVEQPLLTSTSRYFGLSGGNGKKPRSDLNHEIPSRSFMDGVRYDLDIETSGGNTQIQMVFNPITNEELVAAIEGKFSITEDGRTWFGDLTIDRAYYNFFKRFNAEGKIRYTGNFLNPELDIKGTYQGTRTLQDSVSQRRENVVVTIKITGSRLKPKIEMSMTIDGEDYYSYSNRRAGTTSNDVESDAIAFILAGSFPLTSTEKNQVAADVGSSVGSSLVTGAASPLTGVLSDFLRNQVGFINSVELNYTGQGSNLSERADIRLSGTAWNGYWRYGGKILEDPLTNANFSILYSFGTIFNNAALRNLMFELERKVEASIVGAANDFKRVNSARLFYRFSF